MASAATSSQREFPNERLLCYWEQRNERKYFVYWNAVDGRLGVTDLCDEAFEAELDRKERQRMLKNVAEDLVDRRWR